MKPVSTPSSLQSSARLDLSGDWAVRLAPGAGRPVGALLVRLPGGLSEQGIGDSVTLDTEWTGGIFDRSYFTAHEYAPYRKDGELSLPFWLQPERVYVGRAEYSREFEVPADWPAGAVEIVLERPHWKSELWLDGTRVAANDSLSVPHRYVIHAGLSAGKHSLSVHIDNSGGGAIGENSHSISDHTQGNWNGIVGSLQVRALGEHWVEDLRVDASYANRVVEIRGRIGSVCPECRPHCVRASMALSTEAGGILLEETAVAPDGGFHARIFAGGAIEGWDEFNPVLYTASVTGAGLTGASARFGFRDLGRSLGRFTLNARPFVVRGALDCAIFPETGHPPTDKASWLRIMCVLKAHGLNTLRFHSWCPPEAAFEAGDEAGVYFQIEAGSWPNWTTTLGEGKFVDGWVRAESERILRAYGNHPCFVFMAAGNEPGGPAANAWLARWVTDMRTFDGRHLYASCAGWPELPENDFHVSFEPRIQAWGEGLASRINARPPETMTDYREYVSRRSAPVVSHEIGQWCVFPDLAEMTRYTGYLKPRNFGIVRDLLSARHMLDQAAAFTQASGKLQALCYKEDIEAALRTPGMAGFHLLGLQDFPGQGTALVGVVNPFWESKGYITPEAYSRFCNSTVPLARLSRRVFRSSETLIAELEVAHFGAEALRGIAPAWSLVADDGRCVASGTLQTRDIPVGGPQHLGRLELACSGLPSPARLRLCLSLPGTPFANDWDLWIYPDAVDVSPASSVHVSRQLGAPEEAVLARGGTVVWLVPPDKVKGDARGRVQLGFSSIFWNTAWTTGQAPHTLGILCDPSHRALESFPTDSHSNWQWWHVISAASAMILDDFPPAVRPLVQVIDDWFTCRRLALAFEVACGGGRLLVVSADLSRDDNPVRRQLLASLLAHAAKPLELASLPTVSLTTVRGIVPLQ